MKTAVVGFLLGLALWAGLALYLKASLESINTHDPPALPLKATPEANDE